MFSRNWSSCLWLYCIVWKAYYTQYLELATFCYICEAPFGSKVSLQGINSQMLLMPFDGEYLVDESLEAWIKNIVSRGNKLEFWSYLYPNLFCQLANSHANIGGPWHRSSQLLSQMVIAIVFEKEEFQHFYLNLFIVPKAI